MPEQSPSLRTLQIGDWHVDPATGVLSRQGTVRRLRPQVIDVLLALATRPSEVVSKQELLDSAWKGRFVSDSPLTTTIAELREALEDDAKEPRYIQTVPKRGYRLIAPVNHAAPATGTLLASTAMPTAIVTTSTTAATAAQVPTPPGPMHLPQAPQPQAAHPVRPAQGQPVFSGRTARHVVLFTATAAALALLVALSLAFTATAPPSPLVAIPISLEPGQQWPFRTAQVAALSSDGRTLVYTVETAEGRRQLVRRDLQTTAVEVVPGSQGSAFPFFSPDGTRLGFFKQGTIRAIDATGKADGKDEQIAEVAAGFGATWLSNGDLVFAGNYRSGLSLMPPGSTEAHPLTVLTPERQEASHRYPTALPNSRFVLFTALGAKSARIEAVDATNGERHTVVEDAGYARFAAPDRLLYARGPILMSARFDPETARIVSSPVEVARNLAFWAQTGLTQFAVSSSGVLVYLTEEPRIDRELVAVDRKGVVTPLPVPAGPYVHPRISADGRRVAMWQEVDEARDVVVLDLTSNELTPITHDGTSARPVWGPDGQRLAFDRPSTGSPANVVMGPLASDTPAEALLPSDRVQNVEAWLPDGRTMIVSQIEPATASDLLFGRVDTRQAWPLANAPGPEGGAAVSPDGRWVAFGRARSNDGAQASLTIASTDPADPWRLDVATGAGREPRWSRDGHELYYRAGGGMYAIALRESSDHHLVATPAVELFRGVFEQRPGIRANYDVLPDGRFLMLRRRGGSPTQQIIVSVNWKTSLN